MVHSFRPSSYSPRMSHAVRGTIPYRPSSQALVINCSLLCLLATDEHCTLRDNNVIEPFPGGSV